MLALEMRECTSPHPGVGNGQGDFHLVAWERMKIPSSSLLGNRGRCLPLHPLSPPRGKKGGKPCSFLRKRGGTFLCCLPASLLGKWVRYLPPAGLGKGEYVPPPCLRNEEGAPFPSLRKSEGTSTCLGKDCIPSLCLKRGEVQSFSFIAWERGYHPVPCLGKGEGTFPFVAWEKRGR